MPYGFDLNGEYSIYESDLSSRTATISLGVGKDWDAGCLGATYSWTPLANDYRSRAVGGNGAYHSPSKDFRTTVGGAFNATQNTEFVRPLPEEGEPSLISVDVWQMTATLAVKQQIHDTRLTLDLGKSLYDHRIAGLAGKISPDSTRLQGLEGLLPGFPDMEWKVGVSQNVGESVALTLTYDHIRLLTAQESGHGNADSYLAGVEAFPASRLTAALQYFYLIETGQPKSTQWGLTLRVKI